MGAPIVTQFPIFLKIAFFQAIIDPANPLS